MAFVQVDSPKVFATSFFDDWLQKIWLLTWKLIPEVVCCFQKFPGFCSDQTKILLGRWRCCTKMVGHHGRQGGWIIHRFTEFLASSSFWGKTVAAVSDVKSLLSLSTENSSAAPNVALAPCSAAHDAEADADICSSPCWWSYFFAPAADVESLPNWNVDNSSNPPLLLIWRKKLPAEELWLLVLMISCFLHWTAVIVIGVCWLSYNDDWKC